MSFRHAALTLAIIASAGAFAKAQSFEGPDIALAVGVNTIQGSLKTAADAKAGVTASIGLCYQPKRYDVMFRPKLSFTQFTTGDAASLQNLSNVALLADMIWYPGAKQPGFYMFATGGPTYWMSTARNADGSDGAKSNKLRLAVGAGLGYDFTNAVGMEVGYTTSEVTHNLRCNTATMSVVFKF